MCSLKKKKKNLHTGCARLYTYPEIIFFILQRCTDKNMLTEGEWVSFPTAVYQPLMSLLTWRLALINTAVY